MKNNLTILILIVLSISVLPSNACSQKKIENPLINSTKTKSPADVFNLYWQHSIEGDFKSVELVIQDPPEAFWDCYGYSKLACDEKMKTPPSEISKDGNTIASIDEGYDNFIVRESIPNAIYSRNWTSFEINESMIEANQARLRIAVIGKTFKARKDVLLFRSLNGWKIFEITDPGRFESYASIDQP